MNPAHRIHPWKPVRRQYWMKSSNDTHRLGNVGHFNRGAGGEAADLLHPVIDPRIEKSKESVLKELPGSGGHARGILGRNAEFDIVESVDIFKKGAFVDVNLANAGTLPSEVKKDQHH